MQQKRIALKFWKILDKINDSSEFPLSNATIKKYFNCTDG